jgi:polynucleotide 5'-hydroxyl-kinase GRC3/NOL9
VDADIEAPADWASAIAAIAGAAARRVVVIGPTDVGKSSFILKAMAACAEAGRPIRLIDLDPGQKMIGPPGTASLGEASRLERFIFLGSTSASEMSKITGAAVELATEAGGAFIVNTAGWVRGLGSRLQSWTIAGLKPDLIVAIGEEAALSSILAAHRHVPVANLRASSLARRKPPSQRAQIRQAAFSAALEGAEPLIMEFGEAEFSPAPPTPFETAARPVCALIDAGGRAIGLGILEKVDETEALIFARRPLCPVRQLQLGKMSAELAAGTWKLLERLAPTWRSES